MTDLRARDALYGEDVTAVMRDAMEALDLFDVRITCLEDFERFFPKMSTDLRVVIALALARARS